MDIKYLFLALLVIAVIIIINLSIKNTKYKKWLNNGLENNKKLSQAISNANNDYINLKENSSMDYSNLLHTLNDTQKKLDYYKKAVEKSSDNYLPYGELDLLEIFNNKIIINDRFKKWSIYYQLEYKNKNNSHNCVDFLVVSPKGIFVIESKYWNGLTLVYSNQYKSPFHNTVFSDFGTNSNNEITVINVKNTTNKGELKLSRYTNPVSQARKYSKDLNVIFNKEIKNYIIFSSNENCSIKYNNITLEKTETIDKYTSILTQNNLTELFENINSNEPDKINCEEINTIINKNCHYSACLNYYNKEK